MTGAPQAVLLRDGRRLHLHHGPIDLVIEVIGVRRNAAYARAVRRFETLLAGLVTELPALRRPLDGHVFKDPVARRMASAVEPFGDDFVTPMAAVAGAVADEMLDALVGEEKVPKAYVNNGGDIAFHLMPGQSVTSFGPSGDIVIGEEQPSRGLATSGWRGRSHSLGIADAVTVAATSAAAADVAATLIANAVDLPGHPAVSRVPASSLNPDSDLGDRLVTVEVGLLHQSEIDAALGSGQRVAQCFLDRQLIEQAGLSLNGTTVTAGSTQERELAHA